jgi:hypothetical protein
MSERARDRALERKEKDGDLKVGCLVRMHHNCPVPVVSL